MTDLTPRQLDRLRPDAPLHVRGDVALWRMVADDGRLVAMKTLRTPVLAVTLRATFLRQLRVALRLRHPHLVRVFAGRVAREGWKVACVAVTDYLPRGSLLDAVTPGDHRRWTLPLPPRDAVRLVREAAEGVAALHAAQITHGALKPTNILLASGPDGQLRAAVTDYLLQAGMVSTSALAARPTGIADPLLYCAPEQYRHGPTPASDQYALATLAFVLLTGEPPLAVDPAAWLQAPGALAPRRASALNPMLPGSVDAVLERGLRRSPRSRYRNVGEFAAQLSAALDVPEVARSVQVAVHDGQAGAPASRSLAAPQLHETIESPRPLAVVANEPGAGPLGMPDLPPNYRWTPEALASMPPPSPTEKTVQRRGHSRAGTVALGVALSLVALSLLLIAVVLLVGALHR